jgi:hypothetical protein
VQIKGPGVIAAALVVLLAAADSSALDSLTKPAASGPAAGKPGAKSTTAAVPAAASAKKPAAPTGGSKPAPAAAATPAASSTTAGSFDLVKALNTEGSLLLSSAALDVAGRSGSDVLALRDALVLLAEALPVALRDLRSICDPFKAVSASTNELTASGFSDFVTELSASVAKVVSDPPPSSNPSGVLRPIKKSLDTPEAVPKPAAKTGGASAGAKKSGPGEKSVPLKDSKPVSTTPGVASIAASVVTDAASSAASRLVTAPVHPILRAIVSLLVHPLTAVRSAAANHVANLAPAVPELPVALLHALSAYVGDISSCVGAESCTAIGSKKTWYQFTEATHSLHGEAGTFDAGFTFPSAPLMGLIGDALTSILAAAQQSSKSVGDGNRLAAVLLPHTLFLASHPLVCPTEAAAASLWKQVLWLLSFPVVMGVVICFPFAPHSCTSVYASLLVTAFLVTL